MPTSRRSFPPAPSDLTGPQVGPLLTWPGKAVPPAAVGLPWRLAALLGEGAPMAPGVPGPEFNHLIQGDNLAGMQGLLTAGWGGRIALVYMDPPFDSGADYHRQVRQRGSRRRPDRQLAYRDVWGGTDYLQFMYERLVVARELLSETGSLFLHCDFRRVHHLRCLLDEVFGADRVRNEIVWAYGGGARGAKAVAGQFPRNHDVILWYAKGATVPYAPIQVARRVPLAMAKAMGYRQDEQGNWFKTAPRGDYTDASIARLELEGRIHRTRTGSVRIKYPLRHDGTCVIEDVTVGDVWTDIPDAMHASRRERFDYPTRKPVALLERLILAATTPGDWVLDAFGGAGTSVVAAERHRRSWIGLDVNPVAIEVAARRWHVASTESAQALSSNRRPAAIWQTAATPPPGDHDGLTVLVDGDGQALTLRIVGMCPANGDAATETDWRLGVDAVYVDPAFDGRTFRRVLADVPESREAQVAGSYRVPLDQVGRTIGVQVVDVYGGVTTAVVAAPARRTGASAKGHRER